MPLSMEPHKPMRPDRVKTIGVSGLTTELDLERVAESTCATAPTSPAASPNSGTSVRSATVSRSWIDEVAAICSNRVFCEQGVAPDTFLELPESF
jgi:hypothetical protein